MVPILSHYPFNEFLQLFFRNNKMGGIEKDRKIVKTVEETRNEIFSALERENKRKEKKEKKENKAESEQQ